MPAKYLLFEPIVRSLLNTSSNQDEVEVANQLSNVYHKLLEDVVSDRSFTNTYPTHIDGGIALSSQHALDCLQDPLRTVRFIKATYLAIHEAISRFPNKKIELVYAGCGPAAPIVMPLLSLFDPDQLTITLLDINKSSISSVSALINELGATSYFREHYLGDAVLYAHPKEYPLHIVLSETMDKGLTKEPQVRITQNLASQLIENGIFIPEAIKVYTEHSFYSKEPYFDISKNVLALGPKIETWGRQLLFSITKEIQQAPAFEYLSDIIEVPSDFTDTPDICIYADVYIFGDIKLLKAQSLISNPFCVASLYNLKSEKYRLHHTTQEIPDWKYIEQD